MAFIWVKVRERGKTFCCNVSLRGNQLFHRFYDFAQYIASTNQTESGAVVTAARVITQKQIGIDGYLAFIVVYIEREHAVAAVPNQIRFAQSYPLIQARQAALRFVIT